MTEIVYRDGGGPPNALVWVFISMYLIGLLGIGVYSFVKSKSSAEDTVNSAMTEHYLANKNFGNVVLALSTFATVYSGYTVVGVPQEMYEKGFFAYRWLFCCGAMGISIAFFGERLQQMSAVRKYISPTDFIKDRFNSHLLRGGVSVALCWPAMIYVLAQFETMGTTIEGLSDGEIKSINASIVLCIVMLAYETFGGLRAIAWTDTAQAVILLSGFLCMYIVQDTLFGGVEEAGEYMEEVGFEYEGTWVEYKNMLTEDQITGWFGFGIPLFFGYVFYPQMIQRYQAAPDSNTFRKAAGFLIGGHWLAMTSSLCTGMVAIKYFGPKNPAIGTNEVFGQVMRVLCNENFGYNILGSSLVTASLAAFMSTADSSLNGISSCVTNDLVRPYPHRWKFMCQNQEWTVFELKLIGRVVSIIAAIIALYMSQQDYELGALLTMQNAVLMQVFPAFFFGLVWDGAQPFGTFIGFATGEVIALIAQCNDAENCVRTGVDWYYGKLHPAAFAMCVNMGLLIGLSWLETNCFESGFQPAADVIEQNHQFPTHLIGWNSSGPGTVRPWHWPYNIGIFFVLILAMFAIPFYRDKDDYGEPEKFKDGLPKFVRDGYFIFATVSILMWLAYYNLWTGESTVTNEGSSAAGGSKVAPTPASSPAEEKRAPDTGTETVVVEMQGKSSGGAEIDEP